jgi:tetratricopeptide (TPR) repeat protein
MAGQAIRTEFERALPPAAGVSASPLRSDALWKTSLLLLATLVFYWPALRGQFVYDDLWLAAQNPTIRSWSHLPQALTGAYWDFIDPERAARIGYWRPLTSIALFIGHQLGDGLPRAFHAVSLAVHACGVLAAFALARRLTRSSNVAFWTALLFALHPVQVEPVAWISAVNDPLHGLLTLLALDAFLRWRESGSPGYAVATPCLFLLALLAKENAIAIAPLLLAIDLGRSRTSGVVEASEVPGESLSSRLAQRLRPFWRVWAPMLGAFALYWLARVAVFGDWRAGFDRVTTHLGLPLAREMTLRLELLGGYIGLLVWPSHLNLFREIRPVLPPWDPQLWIAIGWIAAWTVLVVILARRGARPALAGALVALAGVLPALARIESLGRFPLSERFLYVSVFGFSLLCVLGIVRWLPKLPATVALAVLCLAAGWRSRERIPVWSNEETLFATSALDNPNSPYVYWGLGRVLMERFRATGSDEALEQAHAAFQHSQDLGRMRPDKTRDLTIFLDPEDRLQAALGEGWYYFFSALTRRGATFGEAEGIFRQTARVFPASEEAEAGLGVALLYQDQIDEAERHLRKALELNEKHLEAWFYLGKLEMRRGRPGPASEAFARALELRPDDPESLALYGSALADAGEWQKAREALARAIELEPGNTQVMLRLGLLAAQQQEFPNALTWFDRALAHDPQSGEAHRERGKVLLALGEVERAVEALERACTLLPSDFEAHYNLGALLAGHGAEQDALPYLERALAIQPEGPHAAELQAEIERLRAK